MTREYDKHAEKFLDRLPKNREANHLYDCMEALCRSTTELPQVWRQGYQVLFEENEAAGPDDEASYIETGLMA